MLKIIKMLNNTDVQTGTVSGIYSGLATSAVTALASTVFACGVAYCKKKGEKVEYVDSLTVSLLDEEGEVIETKIINFVTQMEKIQYEQINDIKAQQEKDKWAWQTKEEDLRKEIKDNQAKDKKEYDAKELESRLTIDDLTK